MRPQRDFSFAIGPRACQKLPSGLIYVNKADINSLADQAHLPLDIMGLFFFAYRDFTGDADALLERQGFGRAHHRVLYFVNLRPGMPVADLLDILKITKQSLARVLKQLIDAGHIVQRQGSRDRRQRRLYPTEDGRALALALAAPQSRRIARALEDAAPAERDAVERFLKQMVDPDLRPQIDRVPGSGNGE